MEQLIFSSVENLPNARASAAFTEPKPVFKEGGEILAMQASKDGTSPTILSDAHAYMPWGATNLMPFDSIDLIESDETLATCQMFNAEVCYGSGLQYDTATEPTKTPSKITSHNGTGYPPYNRPHNATFGRPRRPFLLETQRRNSASS